MGYVNVVGIEKGEEGRWWCDCRCFSEKLLRFIFNLQIASDRRKFATHSIEQLEEQKNGGRK